MPNWLLPENIADVLPSEARKIEELRRVLLDNFRLFGYELVMPPMLEYLDSLVPVPDHEMDLRMFKLVDQLSGRSMGLRADMTIQVARIDAHLLNRASVTRLSYAGSVLHTRPSGLHATREPFQIGAEIYGHAGLEADAEIQTLALESLRLAGLTAVRIDLCHAGIVRCILRHDEKTRGLESEIVALLRAKDLPSLQQFTLQFSAETRAALLALPTLYGDISLLEHARRVLPQHKEITTALDDLASLAHQAGTYGVAIDLADLSGYQYESGATFSLYVTGLPNAVARGGRYDHVGEAFGRARPATGFSMDLRELARLTPVATPKSAIRAPWGREPDLLEMIQNLRHSGEIVIQSLPGNESDQQEFDCDRVIVSEQGKFIIKTMRS
ncbi:MAG: ATP phosphoribosyltransferase regulatory subunit [Burkholderiales bacterium]|jgi:ATP phosphoribosyltransferase regulatory subunit|nr:ATP phosphoribosyltransferase regulatory subunit [Burkholderiales bacterium]